MPGIAGIGCAPGLAAGIDIPCIDRSVAGAGVAGLARDAGLRRTTGFLAAGFLAADLFGAGFFAAGMVIPGMFMP